MKCGVTGVFTLGALLGGAAAVAMVAIDPAMRRRMCCKATRAGRKMLRGVNSMMR